MKQSRLLELDAFRGLAALMVLYYHYTTHYRLTYGHNFSNVFDFDLGKNGVCFFFLISGFVIFMTVDKIESARPFLLRRFSRLYPVYWFCILLTFALVSIFGLEGKETTIREALIGLTMVQDLFNVRHVDESYWSLLPELQFYLFMTLVLWMRQKKYVLYWAIVWVLLTSFSSIYPIAGISGFYKFRYNVLFFSGMLFYQIWKGNRSIVIHLMVILSFILWSMIMKGLDTILISAIFYGLFYVVIYSEIQFLRNRVFLFLGRISYSLYLLHQFIGYIIMNNIKPFVGDNIIIMVGVPTCLVLVLSWLVSKYIEYPSIGFSRKLLKKFY